MSEESTLPAASTAPRPSGNSVLRELIDLLSSMRFAITVFVVIIIA